MSNDTKYWVYRAVIAAMFIVDSWLLGRAIMAGFSGQASSVMLWSLFFGVAFLCNVPLYVLYRRAKINRWQSSQHKTQEQLEVEALAAYAQREQEEKEKAEQNSRSKPVN